ncbi:MAG: hypothetical protein ACFB16_16160 [Phormidesmis sp.]
MVRPENTEHQRVENTERPRVESTERQRVENIEHQRVITLAREYRHEGCQVIIYPSAQDIPPALADCALSLVAKCGEKTVAVAVRTRDTLTQAGDKDLCRISERIQRLANWEFELVVTNPRSADSMPQAN